MPSRQAGGPLRACAAGEPVRLARAGLRARVEAGREPPRVLDHLDRLDEVPHTRRAFTAQFADRWKHDLCREPRLHVAEFRA
ncbi:hypothetical protein [Kitasatospora purpeofusca]|uniref:hypothetical protein n=1 Tax=Kitasatospora purpeofusca TaxID=67352 RepID=UPI0036D2BAC6